MLFSSKTSTSLHGTTTSFRNSGIEGALKGFTTMGSSYTICRRETVMGRSRDNQANIMPYIDLVLTYD